MKVKEIKPENLSISADEILSNEFIDNIVSSVASVVLEEMPPNPDSGNIECFCLLLANELKNKTSN